MGSEASVPVRVGPAAPPPPGGSSRITVDGHPVAVFNVGGRLFGLDARCPHMGGPLDRGKVTDVSVQCPLHGSVFALADGSVQRGPATSPVRAYRVEVDGDGLLIGPSAAPGSG